MVYFYIAIALSFFCSLVGTLLALRAATRVANKFDVFLSMTKELDFEQVAKLTGDIGSLKRSVMGLNNRLNGFDSPKASKDAAIAALEEAQAKKSQNVHRFLG